MFPKPKVFSSKCLGFAACRWNGVTITDAAVEKLKPHCEFVTTCPEVGIGLGVPRDPIRIVLKGRTKRLLQLNTGRDITGVMRDFCASFLGSLEAIDGFILKDRSPSCGIRDVKIYPSLEPSSVIGKGAGFFGEATLARFPQAAIETEARLSNYSLREHFLARLFTIARFRGIKTKKSMKDLVQFHASNKFLIMSYSQKELKIMGKIIANHAREKPEAVFEKYELHLHGALAKPPRYTANINVMMHVLGYFSKGISAKEKRFFLDSLEEYRREQVPSSVPLSILHSHAVRFDENYLLQQTFFSPYPEDLMAVTDSGKGRE